MARWRNGGPHEVRATPGEEGKADVLLYSIHRIEINTATMYSKSSVVFRVKLTGHGFTGVGGKLRTAPYERQLPAGQSHRAQPLPALWMPLLSALLLQTH